MRGFIPKDVDLNSLVEEICRKCVLGRCSEFCRDFIKLRNKLKDEVVYKAYESVLVELNNRLRYMKEHGGEL